MTVSKSISNDAVRASLRKLLAFGAGVGIEIGAASLEVAAARVRPSSVHVLGRTTIQGFGSRPAAEWGMEYARSPEVDRLKHVSATVLGCRAAK